MYYPLKILEEALQDMYHTRAICRPSYPKNSDQTELIKINLHIHQMESMIKMIKGFKKPNLDPETYFQIWDKHKQGESKSDLARQYRVDPKTIYRILTLIEKHDINGTMQE